jgi:hypothetical protein
VALAGGCRPDRLPQEVRQAIGPGGGQISSRDGALTIYLPPSAVESTIQVVISLSETPPEAYGPAYRVQPDVDLALAAEITFALELPMNPEEATVGAIRRDAFAAGDGRWTPLPRIELDLERGVVTAIDHELSMFYALLDEGGNVVTATIGGSDTEDPSTTGETDPTDPTDPTVATTEDTEPGMLSHAVDMQPIWDEHCVANCHEPGGLWSALRLDEGAYDELVGRASLVASVPLVDPGSAQGSYLMHKLDGTYMLEANLGGCGCNGSGTLMPQGAAAPLDISIRDRVRAWIEQGADP